MCLYPCSYFINIYKKTDDLMSINRHQIIENNEHMDNQ